MIITFVNSVSSKMFQVVSVGLSIEAVHKPTLTHNKKIMMEMANSGESIMCFTHMRCFSIIYEAMESNL